MAASDPMVFAAEMAAKTTLELIKLWEGVQDWNDLSPREQAIIDELKARDASV
jgi:hypothetical protein